MSSATASSCVAGSSCVRAVLNRLSLLLHLLGRLLGSRLGHLSLLGSSRLGSGLLGGSSLGRGLLGRLLVLALEDERAVRLLGPALLQAVATRLHVELVVLGIVGLGLLHLGELLGAGRGLVLLHALGEVLVGLLSLGLVLLDRGLVLLLEDSPLVGKLLGDGLAVKVGKLGLDLLAVILAEETVGSLLGGTTVARRVLGTGKLRVLRLEHPHLLLVPDLVLGSQLVVLGAVLVSRVLPHLGQDRDDLGVLDTGVRLDHSCAVRLVVVDERVGRLLRVIRVASRLGLAAPGRRESTRHLSLDRVDRREGRLDRRVLQVELVDEGLDEEHQTSRLRHRLGNLLARLLGLRQLLAHRGVALDVLLGRRVENVVLGVGGLVSLGQTDGGGLGGGLGGLLGLRRGRGLGRGCLRRLTLCMGRGRERGGRGALLLAQEHRVPALQRDGRAPLQDGAAARGHLFPVGADVRADVRHERQQPLVLLHGEVAAPARACRDGRAGVSSLCGHFGLLVGFARYFCWFGRVYSLGF